MAVENPAVHSIPSERSVAKPRTRTRRFFRFLWRAAIYLLAILFVAQFIWKFSGSNEWELVAESKGAKVYTLKQPGSDLRQVKGVVRLRSTLSGAVAWMQDANACKKLGCYENRVERVDQQLEYEHFRFNMVKPFKPRDFILRADFHQIPSTKEVLVEYVATPERSPLNDCCVRVARMNNSWRFTPVGNGEVEAEYTMNMDWGGYLPNPLQNLAQPKYMMRQLLKMQSVLDAYQTEKVDFIEEPTPLVSASAALPAATSAQ